MKSLKRPSDSNSESFSKLRKHKQDGHDTDEEDGSTSLYPQTIETPRTAEDISSQSSSDYQELNIEISQSDDIPSSILDLEQLLSLQLAEDILEVKVDINEKVGKNSKNLPNTGIPDVLNAEFALRNTSGGVIKLNTKTSLSPKARIKKIDEWCSNLNREREKWLEKMGSKEKLAEIIDFRPDELMIFVQKSSIILTEQSNLYIRSGTERHSAQNYFEIQNVFQENVNPHCCCTREPPEIPFTLDEQMPFGESTTVEYKRLSTKNLPDKLRQELRPYIAQFANTNGGTVYFGITDDNIIKGQNVHNKEAIEHKIQQCMESKIWINKCGKKDTPVYGTHYKVNFSQVNGAGEQTFVIEVHICQYAGIVFHKDSEPECKIVNEKGQIAQMSFESWLSSFLKTVRTEGNCFCNYRDRFEKQECRRFTYYSVKQTVQKLVDNFTSASSEQLNLHPPHADKWIKHPALNMLVENTRKFFKEHDFSGIAYIERCWEVNLGLPSTKPDDVICDILICCSHLPLIFVSLTQSGTPDETSQSYNKKVASRIKATLVKESDCLEKFYVKPVVTSLQQLKCENVVSLIYSENPLYPKTYWMSTEKYSKILEALVMVLARANVMSSYNVGRGLFNLLTHEQYKILHEDFEDCQKVKISGPPGSGKTVLALERIQRLRNMRHSYNEVLFLCSNKPLKAIVQNKKTANGEPLCIVKTYYEIASNEGFKDLGGIEHIVADEAQNFQGDNDSLDWWNGLLNLCDKNNSSFWVFFDFTQKINNKRSVSLRQFSKRALNTIIRQTGKVYRFIARYMQVERSVKLGHDFDGQEVDVLVPSGTNAPTSSQLLIRILISQLHKLIFDEGHHVNEIAVLFNDSEQREYYETMFVEQTNNEFSIRNGEEVNGVGVVFDTIRRYSGVDKNIIIGFCPQYYESGFQDNNALMTTLCSRTMLKLILIFEGKQQARHFKITEGLKQVEC